MKRVLVLEFITSYGGVQTVYKNILPELAKENQIYFLNPYSEKDDLQIGHIKNIRVINMPIKSSKALGWKESLVKKIGICFKYGIKYFAFFLKLVRLVKKEKIELLYVSGEKEFFFALLIKFLCNIPYIYHAHGFGRVADINRITKLAINNSKYVICVSNDVKKKIKDSGINGDSIIVVNNALNLEQANEKISRARVLDEPNEKKFMVTFAGTIQQQKGILTLVKAVMLLAEKGCNIKLNIVGKCNDMNYLAEIKNNSSADIVSVYDFCENIYDHFLQTDVVVLPSREESFGMVLLEAMYAKKAVVGSHIGGIPDIIVDGKTGFLFECDNCNDLAKKIKILYENRDLCDALGLNGFARVCNVFNSQKQAAAISALIND